MRDGDGGTLVARSISAVTSSRNKYDKLKKNTGRSSRRCSVQPRRSRTKTSTPNGSSEELAGKIVRQLREANDGRSTFDVFDHGGPQASVGGRRHPSLWPISKAC